MEFHKSKPTVHKIKKPNESQAPLDEEQFFNKEYYNATQKKQQTVNYKNPSKISEIKKIQASFSLDKKEQEEDDVSFFESDEENIIKAPIQGQIKQEENKSSVNSNNQQYSTYKEHELESSSISNKVDFTYNIFKIFKKKNLSITVQEQQKDQQSPKQNDKKKTEDIQSYKSKKANKFFDMREKDQQINKGGLPIENNSQKQTEVLDFHFSSKKLLDSPQPINAMDKMKQNAQFFQTINADLKQKELPPLNERTMKNFSKMKEIEQLRIKEQEALLRQQTQLNQFQQFMHQAISNPQPSPQQQFYPNQYGRPIGANQFNQFPEENEEEVEELVYQLDENGFLMDEQGNYLQDEFGKRVKLTQEELDNLRAQNLIEEEEI